ncbi:MAG: hypothetical protein PHT19_00140 [Methylococcus sp.]|nr:hypothetical protein [Methylococcus sp.]
MSHNHPSPAFGNIALARTEGARDGSQAASWLRTAGILCLWAALAIMAGILWRGENLVKELNASSGERTALQNPDLQQYQNELESLQGRVAGLMKDSVENKLRTLEKSVQSGRFGQDEAGLLEALKSELRFLQNYATQGGRLNTAGEHERYRPTQASSEETAAVQVPREWIEFEKLLYLGVGALGASTLLLSGAWLSGRRLPQQTRRQNAFLAGPSERNSGP